jgi:hypothetical protein
LPKFVHMENGADEIINKVAESGLISLDLAEWVSDDEIRLFDLAPLLLEGYFLKEKEFRAHLSALTEDQFKGKWVGIFCSTDAIIQKWAWMLAAKTFLNLGAEPVLASSAEVKTKILLEKIRSFNPSGYADARVVVKGCGEKFVTEEAYAELTRKLMPVVKSLMYGEPCSTVPVYKKK